MSRPSYSDLEVVPYQPPPPPVQTEQPSRLCLRPKVFWHTVGGVILVVMAIVAGVTVAVTKVGPSDSNNHQLTSSIDAPAIPSTASTTDTITSPSTALSTTTGPSTTSQSQSKDEAASQINPRGSRRPVRIIHETVFVTAAAAPTSTDRDTLTTLTAVGPKQTLYRDCPSSNYTIYNAIGSYRFQFRKYCDALARQNPGENTVNQPTASLNECIDLCAKFNIKNKEDILAGRMNMCNSLCWRYNNNEKNSGICFGINISNSTDSGWSIKADALCDSAAWMNQEIP